MYTSMAQVDARTPGLGTAAGRGILGPEERKTNQDMTTLKPRGTEVFLSLMICPALH